MEAFEQHYSPKQLAQLWGWSVNTIRRLFRHEPGVIEIERPEQMHKRRYTTLKIPASVALIVHQRLTVKARRGSKNIQAKSHAK